MSSIVAISTPQGIGGISIIRLSGEDSLSIASRAFEMATPTDVQPRRFYLGYVGAEERIDQCLMVYFKAPFSYTGEDVVEFHCHGNMLIARRVVELLVDLGATMADRGEFTRRAFLNGKMNLASCEGIADMINADSDASLRAGYRLMRGELSTTVSEMQEILTEVLSAIDGALDYPEELYDDVYEDTPIRLERVSDTLYRLISTYREGRMLREGVSVAIVGEPNTGKSSLLNRILKYDRAIVTDVAGTTRDTLTESVLYRDVKLNFTDTAGIREGEDIVEIQGIERSKEAAQGADLVVVLLDATKELGAEQRRLIDEYANRLHVVAVNKTDLNRDFEIEDAMYISAKTGEGVDELLDKIVSLTVGRGDGEVVTHVRHLDALKRAYASIRSAIDSYDLATIDVTAIDIKDAWSALGEITGTTVSEEIVASIFSRFCVGK
ncbi:MAG: tRNA uridine-5-carboxymethylaminomethyl(34) synthesis GTPase MnmE [Clostridia bacterium]|nr:tRNA uridine-5-carboxymethylaminomethyl(34) synthesis GTPase MnmE [Clostridia bacterium]